MDFSFQKCELVLFDLDGTIYVGDKLIEGAKEKINKLRQENKKVCFLTNNSSKRIKEYLTSLNKMGLEATIDELYTSAQATYEFILKNYKDKKVFLLGTDEMAAEFLEVGVNLVKDNPDVVVLAFDTTMTYDKINKFCRYVNAGATYIATHADLKCPYPVSPMPDVGSFIEFVYAATERRPDVICGKPYSPIAEGIMNKYKIAKDKIAMVGDRLYTDIRFGNNFGFYTIAVLTGETTLEMIKNTKDLPNLVIDSINNLPI